MLSEKKGNSPKVKHLTIQLMQHSCNDKSLAMENGIVSIIERRWSPKGSGTIRRRGLVGISVSLWGWALRSLLLKLPSV